MQAAGFFSLTKPDLRFIYKNLRIIVVSVAQSAEHQVVALGAVGSSPITHPKFSPRILLASETP